MDNTYIKTQWQASPKNSKYEKRQPGAEEAAGTHKVSDSC